MQIVDALSEAHAHGVLHRDIKPGNIMITTRGDAKVMDFGLAKHDVGRRCGAGGRKRCRPLSDRGDIVGTAAYMSPEQARGEPLDPRSDLFSVGVLLYEMVSGQRPFQGTSSAAVAAAILTHEPFPLARFAPDTPAELERIVTKLLKKQPDNRYQTAKDLLIDLRTLKEEQDFQRPARTNSAASGPTPADRAAPTETPADRGSACPVPGGPPADVAVGRARAGLASRRCSLSPRAAGSPGGRRTFDGPRTRSRRSRLSLKRGATPRPTISPWPSSRTLPGDPTITGLMPAISDTFP